MGESVEWMITDVQNKEIRQEPQGELFLHACMFIGAEGSNLR
jgi:hypothetical protein